MATPNIYGELPPELLGDQRAIERQQKIAEALMAQGMAPLGAGRMVGRTFVPPHWAEGLAKLAQAYVGGEGVKKADAGMKDIGQRYSQMYADEIAKVMNLRSGSALRPQQMSADDMAMIADQGGEAAPTVQDMKPDPMGAMNAAVASPVPAVRRIGEVLLQQQLKGSEPFTLSAGGVRYGPDGKIIASAPFKPEMNKTFKVGDIRKVISGDQEVVQEYQKDGSWKEIGKGPRFAKQVGTTVVNPSPVTPVTIQDPDNPDQTIVIDGRTRQVLGKGPKLTETGKINVKTQKSVEGLGKDLQAAEDLLMGQVRDSEGNVTKGSLPTGSGVGTAVDYVAGLVGMSPSGSKEADQLKVVAARLVQKVPRFEGPQSDKDVALYKQAAADAGNSQLPRERRLAAVRTMREIYAGYEDGTRGRVGGGAPPQAPQASGASGGWSIKPIP